MVVLLVFSLALLLGVLTSALAHRSILSTPVLFLAAGFVAGRGVLGIVPFRAGDPFVFYVAEITLFAVLFTDGMKVGLHELEVSWRLPGRVLLFGFPLTMAATAVLANLVAGLSWVESFLLGAVLSPTDPVLAGAIIGREEVPRRLRDLLNAESGLNDGLALPAVLLLLAAAGHHPTRVAPPLVEAALGIGIGVAVPWAGILIERSRFFEAAERYVPLFGVALGLTVLAATSLLHANSYLGAFACGITIATISPEIRDCFQDFGETLTELLKLFALLMFGSLLTLDLFTDRAPSGYLFAVLAWWRRAPPRSPLLWPEAACRGANGSPPPGSAPRDSRPSRIPC
jgi:NhaP-type Na+/H+ or K+/H+ antiporter